MCGSAGAADRRGEHSAQVTVYLTTNRLRNEVNRATRNTRTLLIEGFQLFCHMSPLKEILVRSSQNKYTLILLLLIILSHVVLFATLVTCNSFLYECCHTFCRLTEVQLSCHSFTLSSGVFTETLRH